MYELISHQQPWNGLRGSEDVFARVCSGERPDTVNADLPEASAGWTEIMYACWTQEPGQRPDFNTILTKLKILKHSHAVSNKAVIEAERNPAAGNFTIEV